jgi:hypothetical protein
MKRAIFIKKTGVVFAGFFLGFLKEEISISGNHDLPPLLFDSSGMPIHGLKGWIEKRETIKRIWAEYLGIIDSNPDPPAVTVLSEEKPEGLVRQLIEYESEPGIRVKAYLLRPREIAGTIPAVVALHSTSDNQMKFIAGVEKGEIKALGYNLASRGFIVICPMCFLWHEKGENTYEQQVELFQARHPRSKGMAKMLFDAMRAVDVLENIKEVDKRKIGAVGHSLGAKEAFYLGAFDDRVNVIVSNEGGIGIDFSNWDDPWYLGKEIHSFNHLHHELLALCAPKPFFLIGGDSSDGEKSIPYINAVKPVYKLFGYPENIKLYNHGSGHNITPLAEKRTYQWMVKYLKSNV